jgi:lipopolysaccharide exporter
MENINKKIAKGAAWMISFKLLHRGMTLVSMIVLARLLVPADFGLVALATAFVAALELFTAFSFDVALIQHQNPKRAHYDTVWTIQIIFSAVIACTILLLASPIAGFYQDPRLFFVLVTLSAGALLKGFENVGIVKFRKELQFDREFIFMTLPRVAGFCITIPIAIWLRSYWALIIGILTMNLTSLLASFLISNYRPRWSLDAYKELFSFSKWLLFNNMLTFFRHRASDFVIGKLAGPTALGTFSVAYELSSIPTTELVAPINRAVFPGYAKMAHSLAVIRQGYLDVIGLIAMFAIPAAVGIAVTSELLVFVLLGEKWAAAAPLIAILSLSGAIGAMETNIAPVFTALGKPSIVTALLSFYVAILVPLILILTYHNGALGAAWACLLTGLINVPVYYSTVFRTLKLSILTFAATVWRPLVSAGVMYLVVNYYVNDLNPASSSIIALPQMLLAVLLGVSIYIASITLFWLLSSKPSGAESAVLGEIRHRLFAIPNEPDRRQ